MDQRLQDETDRVRDKFPAWTDAEVTQYAVKSLAYEDALAARENPMSGQGEAYRVEYVTRRGDGWASNALTFDNVEDAEQEARDRSFRWTAVKLARVVPTSTPDRQPCNYDDPGPVVVDYR